MSDKHIHSLADVQIGDTLGPEPLFVPKDQVRTYADNVGMANVPRFTDDEGARKEGLPGMILPGNMSAALIGKLVGDWSRRKPRQAGANWHHLPQSGAARTQPFVPGLRDPGGPWGAHR